VGCMRHTAPFAFSGECDSALLQFANREAWRTGRIVLIDRRLLRRADLLRLSDLLSDQGEARVCHNFS
jgi:hypothetical protein